jgi:spermidine synthase
MLDADVQTRPLAETPVNRDFAPIAYYFDVAMWSGRFNPQYRSVFHSLAEVSFGLVVGGVGIFLLALTGILVARAGKERLSRSAAGFCVAATGFTLMALELMVLLGFQAVFGYVYSQLALLIAAFMVGIAAGSGWALRAFPGALQSPDGRRQLAMLTWLQSLAAISPLLLYALLAGSAQLQSTLGIFAASHVVFPLLALLSGMLGGYQFPLASRIFFANSADGARGAGTLYAVDLAGACLGAVGLSVYLIPVFGFFKTALVMGVLNLAPAALALLSIFPKRPRPA